MKDRHVLITGGSGGLGMAVTKLAIARGAKVVVPYFDESEVERLEEHLGEAAASVELVRADLTQESEAERIIAAMPRIDALIHLVGGFVMGATHQVTLEDWQRHHELVLTTTFLCCKHALARMVKDDYGRIVTIGSKAAAEPMAQMAAYSAAKAGVVALTRVIAAETKGTNVTANCVLPSVIDTAANRDAMGDEGAAAWVTPESLAFTICHLASEGAGDLRGAAIPIYGDV